MRVLVCGGRVFSNRKMLFAVLDRLHQSFGFTKVIHGAARGADSLAEEWAKKRQIDYEGYPARWDLEGKRAAGHLRNRRMLSEGKPQLVVAFPGGTGTEDMVRSARAAGLTVIRYSKED